MAWMRMMGAESVAYHRETIIEPRRRLPRRGPRLLRLPGRDPARLGRLGAAPSVCRCGRQPLLRRPLRPRRGLPTRSTGERLVVGQAAGHGAGHRRPQVGGRAGGAGPGRGHARHHGRRARRHARLSRRPHQRARRAPRHGRRPDRDVRARLRPRPPRHHPGRRPGPHDHVLYRQRDRDARRQGRHQGPRHDAVARAPPRRHHGGRLASAKVAIDLGYGIEADGGPTGKLGHWKIAGIPDAPWPCTPSAQPRSTRPSPSEGFSTYQARPVAARDTRKPKRHSAVDDAGADVAGRARCAGFPPSQLSSRHRAGRARLPAQPSSSPLCRPGALRPGDDVLGPDGTLSARKVFSRRDVIVAVTPTSTACAPAELDRVVRPGAA